MKKCSTCKEEKKIVEFSKDKTRKDGYYHQCKSCRKEYRKTNKEKRNEYNKQYYQSNKEKIKEYSLNNKEKIKEYSKQHYQNNKEIIKEYRKQHYQNNKEKRNEYSKQYRNQRKKIDPLFKLRDNISNLIRTSIKNKGFTKRSQTYKILGCTFEEFKLHLENQFKDGMSWENAGLYGWHLDHIYPVSLAKDEEELIKLNHYTNFQPLWAEDNFKKGNRYEGNNKLFKR